MTSGDISELLGILMLCNLKSPSSYMQAAFRVQNPYEGTELVDGSPRLVRKERAYVFDFDPARTLVIYDEFANNLSVGTAGGNGTQEERKERIRRLLNFFPVLAEDDEGRMVRIDEQQVLSDHFAGGLFDETVFNDSVREFLNKRDELANYFDEGHDEDIVLRRAHAGEVCALRAVRHRRCRQKRHARAAHRRVLRVIRPKTGQYHRCGYREKRQQLQKHSMFRNFMSKNKSYG